MAEFAQGGLDAKSSASIEEHIDGCPACTEVVAAFVRLFASKRSASSDGSQTTMGSGVHGLPVEAELAPGTRIDRYRVLERVGSGAMGVVYAAYDAELDRRIALKVLRSIGDDERTRQRMLREAQALARLSHPNVIAIHDAGTVEGRTFIAMEFVAGTTLGQWSKERPRTWPEIRDVFLDAGRGLAAAHRAGLVHRDFKPDNVLIGSDGRVRVTDFGLARLYEVPAAPTEAVPNPGEAEQETLTRTGTLVGTPAYMAPEAYRGAMVDAASDQFSFCVALYEALCGRRPFEARSLQELAAAVVSNDISKMPVTVRGVSTRVRRAVLRGLARDKEARFPDMGALLEALGHRSRRVRTLGAFGVSAVALTIGISAYFDREHCRASLDDVWNEERRAELRATFEQAELEFVAESWERVGPRIDAFAQRFEAIGTEACASISAEPGSAARLQMMCLEEQRAHVRALFDIWASGDAEALARSSAAVADLGAVERCADAEVLLRRAPDPPPEAIAHEVAEVRRQIATVNTLIDAGRYEQSEAVASRASAQARALGYGPLHAEALLALGLAQGRTGKLVEARQVLTEAMFAATESRNWRAKIMAMLELVYVIGTATVDFDEGEHLARLAAAEIAAEGAGDEYEAVRLMNLGTLRVSAGRFLEGLEAFRAAAALREAEPLRYADAMCNVAVAELRLGRLEQSEDHFRLCASIWESEVGPSHPEVAIARTNLAAVFNHASRYEEARHELEASIAILEGSGETISLEMQSTLAQLGGVLMELGEQEAGLAATRRAMAVGEQLYGPGDVRTVHQRINLARAFYAMDRYEEGRVEAEAALVLAEQFGPDHPVVSEVADVLGNLVDMLGDRERAEALLIRSLKIVAEHHGRDHPAYGAGLMRLGYYMLERGDAAAALELLRVPAAMLDEVGHDYAPYAGFLLAQARWQAGGDRALARREAASARTSMIAAGTPEQVEEVDEWLARHAL